MVNLSREIWRNRDWLYEHYCRKGLSYSQIAEIVGVSKRAVILASKQFGIKSRSISDSLSRKDGPSKEELYHLYHDMGMSQSQIAKKYGMAQSMIYKRMVKFGIASRPKREAIQIRHEFGKRPLAEWANIGWLLEQYKTKSVSEIADVVGWSTTFVHDLMVELGAELLSYSESLQKCGDKISERMRRRWENPSYRKHMAEVRRNYPKVSSLQAQLYDMLDDLGIEYFREYNDKEDDRECLIGYWSFDCVVPRSNRRTLIIECNGDYWHSLPKVMANDRQKSNYIAKYLSDKYELKYLWGHDFQNKVRVRELIKYWLGLYEYVICDFDFRDVRIRQVSPQAALELLGRFHYLGTVRNGSVNYGCYLENNLIAVASFGSAGRKESATRLNLKPHELVEYTRLCIHPKYQKKNFATWFTAKCIKLVKNQFPNAKIIVAFADLTHNHSGTIYRAGNWHFDGVVPPVYWYVDESEHIYHKHTVYSRAVAASMKEADYALSRGLTKTYGREKLRYIYTL